MTDFFSKYITFTHLTSNDYFTVVLKSLVIRAETEVFTRCFMGVSLRHNAG